MNNKLYVFDRGNYSIGEYDLNGETLKYRRMDQGSDMFRWASVFYTNNGILMAKTLDAEEKKLGIEIYNFSFNKQFDRWIMSLEPGTVPKVARNEKNEIFIAGKGSFYGKKSFLTMLNDKGHMINRWESETDLRILFPEDSHRNIKANTIKVTGFDQDGNIYLFNAMTSNKSRISKIKITTEGRGEVLKNYDGSFFAGPVSPLAKGETVAPLVYNNIFSGEIIDIKTGKNGFTYFLYKDTTRNLTRLGLFDPTGGFWKEFSFAGYGSVHGFNLDNQDNVWITDDSGIKKLATYK